MFGTGEDRKGKKEYKQGEQFIRKNEAQKKGSRRKEKLKNKENEIINYLVRKGKNRRKRKEKEKGKGGKGNKQRKVRLEKK